VQGQPSWDVSAALDALVAQVESARAMPMSASCIVNRAEVIDAIEAIRTALPRELASARQVLADRAAVVDQGRIEAQAIIDAATAERSRLVSRTEVADEAAREADRMIEAAQAQIDRMRLEVDEYVDAKLANFEIVLHKTLSAVERGREKISGRHDELAALSDPDSVAEPLPS
jgi:F0F1-type ATP synthase membrane subunit b/b'